MRVIGYRGYRTPGVLVEGGRRNDSPQEGQRSVTIEIRTDHRTREFAMKAAELLKRTFVLFQIAAVLVAVERVA